MISLKLSPDSGTYKKLLSALRVRVRESAKTHSIRVQQWHNNEKLFTGYIPETDHDKLSKSNRDSGSPDYTTVQLPYSYAVAMAAHSFWTNVFLSRTPVLQFGGSTDEGEMQVLAVEALMNYQMTRGRMLPNLYIYLQDAPKYGEAWISPYWREDYARVSQVITEEELYQGVIPTGKMVKRRVTKELLRYQGNSLINLHPAKVFTDPRYPRNRFQEGEFIAIETEVSRNQLIIGERSGQYMNVDRMMKIKKGVNGLDLGEGNQVTTDDGVLQTPDVDSFSTAYDPSASDVYKCYEVTIDLVPKLWGLGKSDLPEKWVFTTDTEFRVIFEARPLGHYHNMFPLAQIEIEPEGYALFSRSLLEIFTPVQQTLDWLINSHFFNVRQVLNNQWLLDPSRIQERDLQNRQPGKAIRLKPAAYGTDIRTALMQLPVNDVTRGNLADMSMMYDVGKQLGISEEVMGVGQPSSRRTAQEIRGSQTFGTSRLKTMAEYFSCTGFSDLSSMMLMNSQQYYDGEMKLRIAGHAAQLAGQEFINITPEMIAGQYYFENVDGNMPIDRYAQANMWREMITQMATIPQVFGQYDMGKLFGYVAQLAGIKNLNRFKVEVLPDAMLMDQAQRGNTVPAAGGNPLEPGQIPMMGPTA